jgi:hypothetical protein
MSDKLSNKEDIKNEVNELMRKYSKRHKSDYHIHEDLKKDYNDSQASAILKKYKEELDVAKKLAEKIKNRLLSKYPSLTQQQYIQKIGEYQKKYNFNKSTMSAILYMLFNRDSDKKMDREFDAPYTQMSKALGYIPQNYHFSGALNYSGEEEEVKEILKLGAMTDNLHEQVQLQSLIYESCSNTALMNNFPREKFNMTNHIHPVLFALFFPKFEVCDRHMLFASIPKIIKRKYNGEDLQTQPDVELYDDIAKDPVETTCTADSNKPFTDLLSRANVQVKLWENVVALREGKFYSTNLDSFMTAINTCKANIFDMADYAYVKDEATILRKLFAAFSLRPTYITVMPLSNASMSSPIMAQVIAPQVSTIPMVPLRMNNADNNKDNNKALNLTSALNDRQTFFQNKQIVVKEQSIIYSKDLIVFYVNRRFQANSFTRLMTPYQMPTLPITMSTYERLNDVEVEFPFDITIASQSFKLRSAVAIETVEIQKGVVKNNQIIAGCSAIVIPDNMENFNDMGFVYTPLNYGRNNDGEDANLHPIDRIPVSNSVKYGDGEGEISSNVIEKLCHQGTLFIYECTEGISQNHKPNIFGF